MKFTFDLFIYDGHKGWRRTNAFLLAVLLLFVSLTFLGCSNQKLVSNSSSNTTVPAESKNIKSVYISLDKKDDGDMPERFRKCNDSIDNNIAGKVVSLEGLAGLNISGSGQFTEKSLQLIKQKIGNKMNIIVVDLRQESHGFVNNMAISWTDADDKANKGLTTEQVIEDENSKLSGLLSKGIAEVKTDKEETIKVDKIQTEEQLVKSQGMSYLRLPVTNNERPADDIVDTFVNFVRSQPKNTWIHFHCMEGVGRTTTFMFMYDSMKNARKASIDDIMTRQVLLGGKNLVDVGSNTQGEAGKRALFLRMFYKYCRENSDNYNTSWSKWVKAQ